MRPDRKPSVKLLHTADLHLGNNHCDHRLQTAVLAELVNAAISEAVDAVIIAGDLFDRNRASLDTVEVVLGELGRLAVPTVILPGNHDSFDEGSIYRQIDFGVCPTVRLLCEPAGDLLCFPHLNLTVWGKPVVEHCPDFRPMAGMPSRNGTQWHIGVAHGMHVSDVHDSDRSSLITSEEIASSGWDYIALGHVHSFRDVSQGQVVACYPGSPVQNGLLEPGSGYVAIVHLDSELGVFVRQVPISQPHRF